MRTLVQLLCVLMVAPALGQVPGVEYVVRLQEAPSQVVRLGMTIRAPEGATLDVALPVWRPGRYEVLDPAGTIRSLSARYTFGKPLPAEKIATSTWRITLDPTATGEDVVVEYEVYANSLGDRTRHADGTHAFLSGSAIFLFRPGMTGAEHGPLRVTLDAPEGWRVATGLAPEGDDPRVLTARSYDELVDCPLEIGLHERIGFAVDGVPHEIVLWCPGGPPGYELAQWPPHFEKIIRAQRDIFGRLPYERYVFLVHAYPGGGGGTEHVNSTIMQTNPGRLESENSFKGMLGLVSHEFFHTWNIKQFRPAGLKPYDYLRENYTRLLWVAEGTTSYYSPVVLVRAGITKPDDYLRSLGNSIDSIRSRPGAGVQSLEESSFDAWIKFNKSWPDSANSTVSFYDKGALASLALDMEVRKQTGNAQSLDDVMRAMFEKFPLGGPPYTTDDLLTELRAAAGSGFEEFFERHIAGVEPIDFESALAVAGLELKRGSGKDDKDRPYLGLNVRDSDGLASVSSVASDGPAYASGILAGDLILAIDGRRLTAGGLDAATRRLEPGQTATVALFRYDTLREIELMVGSRPDGRWTVRRVKDPTEEQIAVYESWLKQEWPGERTGDEEEEEDVR